jgi:hypothetical protein
MPKADVGPNVTLFGQENGQFCGEANAKMARNGYPDPGNRVPYQQAYLYNIIQAHNSNSNDDKGQWSTDPQGLRLCLQLLSTAPVNWAECATADRQEALFFIERCIDKEKYPTPVLTGQGQHWVLVVGWETVAVAGGGKPSLKYVHYYDPEPQGHGADITVAGSAWNRPKRFSRVTAKGTWMNKFVAIGQRS